MIISENKAEYRRFIQERKDIPVFFQDWWLDVVSGTNDWEVILIKGKGRTIQLIMPFIQDKKFGWSKISQPGLTPFLGIKIFYPDTKMKHTSRYSFENKILTMWSEYFQQKNWVYFNQFFDSVFRSLLPLTWSGFNTKIYYRNVIQDIKNLEMTFQKFHENRKYDIKKFKRSKGYIERTEDTEIIYNLIKQSFSLHKSKIPYSKQLYLRLDQQIFLNSQRIILLAKNTYGEILAGVYVIIDFDRAYLLSTGRSKQSNDSTATAALIWEAIQYAAKYVNTFDFCGSMIPSISKFFQGFGGTLEPYPKVTKHRSRWLNLIFALLKK